MEGALISALGIQLQLAASLLCLGLGLVLRRGIGHRPWMSWWAWSFGALALAVGALLVRYQILPLTPLGTLGENESEIAAALYAVYAGAKLVFLGSLLAGTWLYVTRQALPRVGIGAGLLLLVSVATLFMLAPTDLNPLMAWQAGIAIPVFLACAWLLRRLPVERKSRGSRALQLVFLALALLWAVYIPAFLRAGPDSYTPPDFLGWLTRYNSYVDVLFQFLLGFGMILAVLDDFHGEAVAARQARLDELADSEARLNQIIRAASDGIVLLDAEHRIMHCNPAALGILGCEADAVLGQPFDRFVLENSLDDCWGNVDIRPDGQPATPPGGYELKGKRADGSEFPMELSLRAIGKTEPEGYVMILRDRTQRARVEEERERMQTQLAQAARLETIGRMISGVAHELNNPLTAILAFGQDLLSQPRSSDDTEALQTIVQQSQRCRAIVQDLLTFARTKREDRQVIALHEIVERVRPAFERLAAADSLRLEVRVSRDLPPVHANPAALEQVLTNLLSNAFHAAGSGGWVAVSATLDADQLALIVEDDGPGIPPEALPRLFEPFFTTKAHGKGTGLGLSVSHGIVEQHGGKLQAANREGRGLHGARFTVLLPFLDRRAVSRSGLPALPRTELVEPPAQRTRRLLIADDEAAIRTAIRRYLERRGWQVDEAKNGREALELLGLGSGGAPGSERYDAIVTDLRMPGISGIEIHDQLAAQDPPGLEKLIVITGDTASLEVAEFIPRLRRPVIQKPFDMRALADLLDRTAPPPPRAAPAAR
ncbi:MAG TPA: ATP-binding protein [Gemmatimonadales bacterium]|jgi:two-component system NtrC family sensor kinase|nr:ATP-binding protein [Gemmatimonadales bacterium]